MLSFRFVQTRFAACPVPFGTPLAFTKAQTISSPCHLMWFRAPHFRALAPTPATRIVVEPSPVRGLAADCPICMIFRPSHLGLFHPYAVAHAALRGFQQLKGLFLHIVSNMPTHLWLTPIGSGLCPYSCERNICTLSRSNSPLRPFLHVA